MKPMGEMKSVSVFCGANPGHDPAFLTAARDLGRTLAERKITVVYGGADVGLMGALADAALETGGQVIGVMPGFLKDREIAHKGLSEIHFCETMHERKQKMFELSQGFIALPGGFGTLDEIFEIITWRQLGFHSFPVKFLNVNGYFDKLIEFIDGMEGSGLLRPENRQAATFHSDIASLFS